MCNQKRLQTIYKLIYKLISFNYISSFFAVKNLNILNTVYMKSAADRCSEQISYAISDKFS